MAEFRDLEAAARTRSRLARLAGLEDVPEIDGILAGSPDPDRSLANLERWLAATVDPAIHVEQLLADLASGSCLGLILGASQPLADSLVQSPELASIFFDPQEAARKPKVEEVRKEAELLLKASASYTHSLDRLRYLRQRWTLGIALNDLTRDWGEEEVWQAISDLAEALIGCAAETAWREFSSRTGKTGNCPLAIIAFGKFGGRELNYSSDIDLAYVLPEEVDERAEAEATRLAESLGRAISDRMGRGFLYRVDLRLRPYGAAGPIVRSMPSYERYYRLYAEPWEVQALVKSRVIFGDGAITERWERMRHETCFRPSVSEMVLDSMLDMRGRIESGADHADIKRGPGGIRDVEFLAQILQMVEGHRNQDLTQRSTLDVLRALESGGTLDHGSAEALRNSYTFLRQLEHRIQLMDDRQTHSIPSDPRARRVLAGLMGERDWAGLDRRIEGHRRTIVSLYQSILRPSLASMPTDRRAAAAGALGPLSAAALQWFDSMEGSEEYYGSLLDNESSLERVRRIIERAPALVSGFKANPGLTEELLSGEIEESAPSLDMRPDAEPRSIAHLLQVAWIRVLSNWSLADDLAYPGQELSAIADHLIRLATHRAGNRFDVIGLGSFGSGELSVMSDCDLLLLVSDGSAHHPAELAAQSFLDFVSQLHRYGSPFTIDLRLRPEGKQGLLVRTHAGFSAYELEAMEMWERFALGEARLIQGNDEALQLVRKAAYAQPLTPERLKELIAMKRRIETERVSPQHLRRDVKLGLGGLSDIDWLVHLLEMRYPSASGAIEVRSFPERVGALAKAWLINTIEADALLHAREHLQRVRARIALLGLPGDRIPENPNKLDRLAHAMDFADGYEMQTAYEQITGRVREIYTETLERLRA